MTIPREQIIAWAKEAGLIQEWMVLRDEDVARLARLASIIEQHARREQRMYMDEQALVVQPATRRATRKEKIVKPGVYEVPVEQPQQEPVAWFYEERGRRWVTDALHEAQHANDGVITPLYTAPQPRKRLTDEELGKIINANWGVGVWQMGRAIEAAHGITGEQK